MGHSFASNRNKVELTLSNIVRNSDNSVESNLMMTFQEKAMKQHIELPEESLSAAVLRHLVYSVGKDQAHAVTEDWCAALSLAVRDRMVNAWMDTTRSIYKKKQKRVYYLSMEFMIGRLLEDAITNIGLEKEAKAFFQSIDMSYRDVLDAEPDAALGNGGLGRLAACFMDGMSSVGVAGMGYGIRYDHGIFRQGIEDGWQVEEPEDWLLNGNPWEFNRPEVVYNVDFGGTVTFDSDDKANWKPNERIHAAAFDMPIAGWRGEHVNTLRLWSARPAEVMDLSRFNEGDFMAAAHKQIVAESISKVLYPGDHTAEGRELRLKQEVFFTSASLQDLLHRYCREYDDLADLGKHVAIQLNDTHPAIAVAELIRLLVDGHDFTFNDALKITRETLHYTNHTLLPEALEKWPFELFERCLPRHLHIINQIDGAFYQEALDAGIDHNRITSMQTIHPYDKDWVRMGNLAFIGSRRVNGVSALHTKLMKETVFKDMHEMYPDKILNQTNGIAPRRWLLECNLGLAEIIIAEIGTAWIKDLEKISALSPKAKDAKFRQKFIDVKKANKVRLATYIKEKIGVDVNPNALFDIQIKRIHEYKRQLLNILETMALYNAIKADPNAGWQPRVKIFAGKAAPSYDLAKLIIKLINDVAETVNNDKEIGDTLKVVFLPNYNVSAAEILIPAADLSEQISTAGFEASGTGNMKFALNGALTVGTLDGANVEMVEHVGAENFFIFGLEAHEIAKLQNEGTQPWATVASTPRLQEVVTQLTNGYYSNGDTKRYNAIVDNLIAHDYFQVTPDFEAYWNIQRLIDETFKNPEKWHTKAILNTAYMGWFSSDRTIRGYAKDIWQAL